jgi:hypothetical protein
VLKRGGMSLDKRSVISEKMCSVLTLLEHTGKHGSKIETAIKKYYE